MRLTPKEYFIRVGCLFGGFLIAMIIMLGMNMNHIWYLKYNADLQKLTIENVELKVLTKENYRFIEALTDYMEELGIVFPEEFKDFKEGK